MSDVTLCISARPGDCLLCETRLQGVQRILGQEGLTEGLYNAVTTVFAGVFIIVCCHFCGCVGGSSFTQDIVCVTSAENVGIQHSLV